MGLLANPSKSILKKPRIYPQEYFFSSEKIFKNQHLDFNQTSAFKNQKLNRYSSSIPGYYNSNFNNTSFAKGGWESGNSIYKIGKGLWF
jgi:hypothetical protein